MTEINAPLLWKVYDHIKNHPKEWDQNNWISRWDALYGSRPATLSGKCGTTACFAGWTVQLSGHNIIWGDPAHGYSSECDAGLIEDVARRELGLNDRQATRLFYSLGSIDNIHALLVEFTGENRPA